jgi:DNA-binding NarL/FixJ family response regulator
MSKILIGIYDEHLLLQEGLQLLITQNEEFEIVLKANNREHLFEILPRTLIHILLVNIYALKPSMLNLLIQINSQFPKIKVLALSAYDEEEIVLRTIKAGAKGFIAKDTNKNEFTEAIYTLRNGFDYYSKSITHILLNKYITKLKINNEAFDINSLSTREVEILKLWGNSYGNKEIADQLFISVRTVESHKNHIMQKLNLKTTVDLVKFAIKNNIIEV